LEDERSTDINVPAVASGLDTLIGSDEGADNEGGGLANGIKRPKLEAHGETMVVERKDRTVRSVASWSATGG